MRSRLRWEYNIKKAYYRQEKFITTYWTTEVPYLSLPGGGCVKGRNL
jgi:hypothetical protein